jgi:hypothetical protein
MLLQRQSGFLQLKSTIVAVFIHNHFESAIIVGQKQWCEFIIL